MHICIYIYTYELNHKCTNLLCSHVLSPNHKSFPHPEVRKGRYLHQPLVIQVFLLKTIKSSEFCFIVPHPCHTLATDRVVVRVINIRVPYNSAKKRTRVIYDF